MRRIDYLCYREWNYRPERREIDITELNLE